MMPSVTIEARRQLRRLATAVFAVAWTVNTIQVFRVGPNAWSPVALAATVFLILADQSLRDAERRAAADHDRA
jgi:hypothetical protein